jgi:hypothetical protein
MTIGPEPMIRILWMSVRFGMSHHKLSFRNRRLAVCVTFQLALQGRNILHKSAVYANSLEMSSQCFRFSLCLCEDSVSLWLNLRSHLSTMEVQSSH